MQDPKHSNRILEKRRLSPSPQPVARRSFLNKCKLNDSFDIRQQSFDEKRVSKNQSSFCLIDKNGLEMSLTSQNKEYDQTTKRLSHLKPNKTETFSKINNKINSILQNYQIYSQKDTMFPFKICCTESRILQDERSIKSQQSLRFQDKENFSINQRLNENKNIGSRNSLKQRNSLHEIKMIFFNNLKDSLTFSHTTFAEQFLINSQTSDFNHTATTSLEQTAKLKMNQFQNYVQNQEKQMECSIYHQQSIKRPKLFNKRFKKDRKEAININKTLTSPYRKKQFANSETDKFFQKLKQQIALDELFIKAKNWFNAYKKDHKWWLLERQLKKNKLWANQLTMKSLFMINTIEQNPFQTLRQNQSTIKELVKSFKQAELHWANNICQQFDFQALKTEGFFQISEICIFDNLSIEDLIRFVNCQLQELYHHLQLQLIYLRLKHSEHLNFFDIVQSITKPSQ